MTDLSVPTDLIRPVQGLAAGVGDAGWFLLST